MLKIGDWHDFQINGWDAHVTLIQKCLPKQEDHMGLDMISKLTSSTIDLERTVDGQIQNQKSIFKRFSENLSASWGPWGCITFWDLQIDILWPCICHSCSKVLAIFLNFMKARQFWKMEIYLLWLLQGSSVLKFDFVKDNALLEYLKSPSKFTSFKFHT